MESGCRINIIGASGTGKTTVGRALAGTLCIPHFDSDFYFHLPSDPPFQHQRDPQDRCSLVTNDLAAHASWVLSGAVAGWRPAPELDYTLVVFLSLPLEIRLQRLRQRESQLYGSRILQGGDMESDHRAFLEWTAGYDTGECEGTNTRLHHEAFMQSLTCKVLRFEEPMSVDEQIRLIVDSTLAAAPAPVPIG